MLLKSFLVWLLIIPLAVFNGALRDMVLAPKLGKHLALPVSGLLLCLLIMLVATLILPRIIHGSSKVFWRTGLLWMMLTIAFEFTFGLATGGGFTQLLAAYDITTGNLWSLVVLFTGIAPWLGAKIRGAI